jgi:hypothetical protein
MTRNRFAAECSQTRAQTWRIRDRATGAVVMDHLPLATAKEWTRGMNEDQRAGRMIVTMAGDLAPTASK